MRNLPAVVLALGQEPVNEHKGWILAVCELLDPETLNLGQEMR